ncbi:hypothetical protein [Streptomyces cyaneus]|uniref:hypothetical protein n=1 Tax=Streptomyces cyaneus TaxID=1904 RepID=UPI001FEC35E5|nr:hypothetical protein [Streptomyces cyaneus]
MTPVSSFFSQRSHQRSVSWRKPSAGPRQAPVRVLVRPGADQAEDAVGGQVLDQAQDRVAVRVLPAAHREDGGVDRAVASQRLPGRQ